MASHERAVEVELEAIADWEFDRQYVYLGGVDQTDGPAAASPSGA